MAQNTGLQGLWLSLFCLLLCFLWFTCDLILILNYAGTFCYQTAFWFMAGNSPSSSPPRARAPAHQLQHVSQWCFQWSVLPLVCFAGCYWRQHKSSTRGCVSHTAVCSPASLPVLQVGPSWFWAGWPSLPPSCLLVVFWFHNPGLGTEWGLIFMGLFWLALQSTWLSVAKLVAVPELHLKVAWVPLCCLTATSMAVR